MAFENAAGINVFNHYGARSTGGSVGVEHSKDSVHQLSIALTGESLNSSFLPPVVVPKGAHFLRAILRVDEAFVVGGTTPTIEIGSAGSTATNGFVVTEAELEAVGTKIVTSTGAGTWSTTSATGLTAAAKVAIAKEGDTTVTSGVGKGTLILEFINKTKA